MIIYPAIDLLDGKVVRLRQGDYNQATVFSDDPVAVAEEMHRAGARWIHMVDLDGAREGSPRNLDVVYRISRSVPVKIQFGGGLRSILSIEDTLEAGAERAVISTRALLDEEFLALLSSTYVERLAVSIDARGDKVYLKGWKEAAMSLEDAFRLIQKHNIPHLIFTDIERDGTNQGVNLALIEKVLKMSPTMVIAAGGVSSLNDVIELAKLETKGLTGIIIGRAYYEGLIDLKEVFKHIPQDGGF